MEVKRDEHHLSIRDHLESSLLSPLITRLFSGLLAALIPKMALKLDGLESEALLF